MDHSLNRVRLVRTARVLKPLPGEFVFVGGQVAELLVTAAAAVRVRPTDDVDVVVRWRRPARTTTSRCASSRWDSHSISALAPRLVGCGPWTICSSI